MALRGIKVIEFLGLAPGPLCGTILADFGATVTVVQKVGFTPIDELSNGKRVISVDLKSNEGIEIVKKMSFTSDVILDTFRPGILEKLGLGPDVLCESNPRLIFARLTGFGQTGLYKNKAGHDINYIALSGVLSLLSKNKEPPVPPINLVADFAGGSLLCALGILLALYDRTNSGKGQVIDLAMTEGVSYLATWIFKSRNLLFNNEPGANLLDGGVPWYGTYKTKDGKFMAVGALEPQFYDNLLKGLGLSSELYNQTENVNVIRKTFEETFLSKTQEEWCHIFDNTDACVTPVLDINNIDENAFHKSKKSFFRDLNDNILPEPSPGLSRTPATSVNKLPSPIKGQQTIQILQELGYSKNQIKDLIKKGCVYAPKNSNL